MLTNLLVFLLDTFFGLFALALLLRFYLQVMRAPARNPVSTFVVALTNWIVAPARRFVPGLFGVDLSTLVLAWLTELLLLALKHLVTVWTAPPLLVIAVVAAVQIAKLSVWILMIAVLVQAVLSWVAPYSPAMPVLNSLSRPFLAVFRRYIPPVGNVDLSPIFVLIGCQVVLYLIGYAEALIVS